MSLHLTANSFLLKYQYVVSVFHVAGNLKPWFKFIDVESDDTILIRGQVSIQSDPENR